MLIGLWDAAKLGYERGRTAAMSPLPPRLQPTAMSRRWLSRRSRAWLGVIGVALLTQTVLLAGLWWPLPLLAVCAWWWCPAGWRWSWLVPLGCGLLGYGWTIFGIGLLDVLPIPVAAVLWTGTALGLAGAARRARSTLGRPRRPG